MYDEVLEIQNPYDEILPNLFLGGALANYSQFDAVICLTPDVSFHGRPSQPTFLIPFNDTRAIPSTEFLMDVVDLVLQRLQRGSVLVHCSAGCNRSGLIVGLVMIELGHAPQEAIDQMRAVRSCSVLHNTHFEAYVAAHTRRAGAEA